MISMNKRNLRAFAFGVFFTVCLIGAFYFSNEYDRSAEISVNQAQDYLKQKGYIILTKEQHLQLLSDKETANQKKESIKQAPSPLNSAKQEFIFILDIKSGMVSHDIANILHDKKIIDDAKQFESFLEENGFSKRIQLGSFEVKSGMSFAQIAKVITKS